MENKPVTEYERKTPGGFLIKIKPTRHLCIVFQNNVPEVPRTGGSMEQAIPCLMFIGRSFDPVLKLGTVSLVQSRGGKIAIPYKIKSSDQIRYLTLACHSASDQFPVQVQLYESIKQFLSKEAAGHPYRYMVLDPDVQRVDMVALKVNQPEAHLLLLEKEKLADETPAVTDQTKIRASDLLKSGTHGELAGNPVFLARLYLRDLELKKVKDMLTEKILTGDEIQFIRTFLKIMINNDQKKHDLEGAKIELYIIDELYRLSSVLSMGQSDEFDATLDKGMAPALAAELIPVLEAYRRRASDKIEELRLWEWDFRLRKMAGSK